MSPPEPPSGVAPESSFKDPFRNPSGAHDNQRDMTSQAWFKKLRTEVAEFFVLQQRKKKVVDDNADKLNEEDDINFYLSMPN